MLKYRANVKTKEIKLPIGIEINGEIFKTCVVKGMDGNDEENISERKIQNNGGKVITQLLARKIIQIGDKEFPNGIGETIARNMFTDDRDTCLFEIRGLMSDIIDCDIVCRLCGEKIEATISISEQLKQMGSWDDKSEYHDSTLPLGVVEFTLPDGLYVSDDETKKELLCRKGKLTIPRGRNEEGIAGENLRNTGKINSLLLASCIIELENIRRVDKYVVQAFSKVDREYLSNLLTKAQPGPKMIVKKECICGNTCRHMLQLPYFFTLKAEMDD